MLGVIILAFFIAVLIVLWVLLARWRLGDQQRENGHEDRVQQLLLQNSLKKRKINY